MSDDWTDGSFLAETKLVSFFGFVCGCGSADTTNVPDGKYAFLMVAETKWFAVDMEGNLLGDVEGTLAEAEAVTDEDRKCYADTVAAFARREIEYGNMRRALNMIAITSKIGTERVAVPGPARH